MGDSFFSVSGTCDMLLGALRVNILALVWLASFDLAFYVSDGDLLSALIMMPLALPSGPAHKWRFLFRG